MELVYNFGAGPAMLPREVMQTAQQEFLDWHDFGMSVMEMSHRNDAFVSMAQNMEKDLRELLAIPNNYKVLFLHGGASSQFAMVPLNLKADKKSADYFHTGAWSGKAINEAKRFIKVNSIGQSNTQGFTIPEPDSWMLDPHAAYVYYADNETIHGIQFHEVPNVGDAPLVADMTSSLLSKCFDMSRFGVVFAAAQKNIGLSGMTVVIVREDLIGYAEQNIPSLYDYAVHVEHHSMFNTPATYSWYISGLVLQWVKQQGGVKVMQERSKMRAGKLYETIDNSKLYNNCVVPEYRSTMNVPFVLRDDALNEKFIREAEACKLISLKGHRSVGGMRASMYNSMPMEAVDTLVGFMQNFELDNACVA